MAALAPDEQLVDRLTRDAERVRDAVASLGKAIHAADLSPMSPSVARAAVAAENLYARIDAEFGLLTSTEAGERMGSRAQAPRNLPAAARREGRLVALQRGRYVEYPGFQFDEKGVRPVIADLVRLASMTGRSEAGLVQWLASPTTYLDGLRPIDVLDEPERLMHAAEEAFGVQW